MKRRDLLTGVFAGAGVWHSPRAACQTHVHGQLVPGPGNPAPGASTAPWEPLLFDEHQAATVEALVERIIPATDTPGAKEARVVEYIDLVLHDGDAARRHRFLEGIGWLDGQAIRRHQAPFLRLSEEEQNALLTEIQESEIFRLAKELTVEGYYTSRIGIEELNKGGRVPETFACVHESHETR